MSIRRRCWCRTASRPPSRACRTRSARSASPSRKNSPDLLMVVALHLARRIAQPAIHLATTPRCSSSTGCAASRASAACALFGGRDYNMRIWIDPDRAAARNLTVDEIVAAVRAQNAQVAAGAVGQPPFNQGGTAFQLGIQAQGRLTTPEEFGDIIVKRDDQGAADPAARRRADRARRAGLQHQRLSRPASRRSRSASPSCPARTRSAPPRRCRPSSTTASKSFPPGLTYSIPYNPTEYIARFDRGGASTRCSRRSCWSRWSCCSSCRAGARRSSRSSPFRSRWSARSRCWPRSASRSTTCRCSAWCWRSASSSTTRSSWSRISSG